MDIFRGERGLCYYRWLKKEKKCVFGKIAPASVYSQLSRGGIRTLEIIGMIVGLETRAGRKKSF